jgi:hypothetical protein
MGLEIEDNDTSGALLLEPCRALQGKRCGIYAHRPECCRTFECRLLQDVRRGTVGVERAGRQIAEALKRIRRVRELMAHLGRRDERLPLGESCAEALARDADADPGVNRKRARLEAAMSAVEESIRKTFLDGGGRSHAHRAHTSTSTSIAITRAPSTRSSSAQSASRGSRRRGSRACSG